MKAKEILELIASPWCSNQDIMKIANLSASTASKVKRTIDMDFRKKESYYVYTFALCTNKRSN